MITKGTAHFTVGITVDIENLAKFTLEEVRAEVIKQTGARLQRQLALRDSDTLRNDLCPIIQQWSDSGNRGGSIALAAQIVNHIFGPNTSIEARIEPKGVNVSVHMIEDSK